MTAPAAVLAFSGLSVEFATRQGPLHAVRHVDLEIGAGEIVALVGESGCGKSVTCLAAMGLAGPTARMRGAVHYRGRDLLTLPAGEMRRLRGDRLTMVFQDPMTALNPYMTIGRQVAEVFEAHRGASRAAATGQAEAVLARCGFPDTRRLMRSRSFELSGGMRQRVVIAMALALEPEVVFADEPTTALDVTTQARILAFFAESARRARAAVVFVTHDLGVVGTIADRVAVMYAGQIVETAPTRELTAAPRHPYTRALLAALPRLDGPRARRLPALEGMPPRLMAVPEGCAFAPRCALRRSSCETESPALVTLADGRALRCPVVQDEVLT